MNTIFVQDINVNSDLNAYTSCRKCIHLLFCRKLIHQLQKMYTLAVLQKMNMQKMHTLAVLQKMNTTVAENVYTCCFAENEYAENACTCCFAENEYNSCRKCIHLLFYRKWIHQCVILLFGTCKCINQLVVLFSMQIH